MHCGTLPSDEIAGEGDIQRQKESMKKTEEKVRLHRRKEVDDVDNLHTISHDLLQEGGVSSLEPTNQARCNATLPWRAVHVLYVAHVAIGFWRTTFDAVLPLMLKDERFTGHVDASTMITVLGYGTAAYVLGKTFAGLFVDQVITRFGAKVVLVLGLASPALASAIIGTLVYTLASTFAEGAMTFLIVCFCAGRVLEANVWPSMTRTVQLWFSPEDSARAWGVLSTSSRVGYISADILYGALIELGFNWGQLFLATSGFLFLAICLVFAFLPCEPPQNVAAAEANTREEESKHLIHLQNQPTAPPQGRGGHATANEGYWLAMVKRGVFWGILITVGALTSVAKVKSLAPLFLNKYVGLSVGYSTMTTSLFSVGGAVSALVGGYVWPALSPTSRTKLVGGLTAILVASFASLAFMVQTGIRSGFLSVALLLVVGLSFGLPYYVPSNVFAVTFGKHKSGGVTAVLDVFGYGCEILLLMLTSYILQHSSAKNCDPGSDCANGFVQYWMLYSVVSCIGCVSATYFMHLAGAQVQ